MSPQTYYNTLPIITFLFLTNGLLLMTGPRCPLTPVTPLRYRPFSVLITLWRLRRDDKQFPLTLIFSSEGAQHQLNPHLTTVQGPRVCAWNS